MQWILGEGSPGAGKWEEIWGSRNGVGRWWALQLDKWKGEGRGESLKAPPGGHSPSL